MTTPPDQTVKDLAHLAFCALVALYTAIQQGTVTSPIAEHLFLVRWLATAQKQKRFPRSVALDIQQLLDKGRKQGIEAKLKTRFDYIGTPVPANSSTRMSCSGSPTPLRA